MSEMEAYSGRLIPVDRGGRDFGSWVQELLGGRSLEELGAYDWREALMEEAEGFIYDRATDTVYEVQRERLDPSGFLISERGADGSYSFTVSYYNGGASFSEAVLSAVRSSEG